MFVSWFYAHSRKWTEIALQCECGTNNLHRACRSYEVNNLIIWKPIATNLHWFDKSSSPVQYIKKSLQNGMKTSPSNLISGGYEKLTLSLPDTNAYPCNKIGCTLSSPLVFPTFCTIFVLKICLFSFPPIKIFPSYSNFTNYNHQKYKETTPCTE